MRVYVEHTGLPNWTTGWQSQPNRNAPQEPAADNQAWAFAVEQVTNLIEQQPGNLALSKVVKALAQGDNRRILTIKNEAMKITDMNWMQVEDYLKRDDRAALPLGCTEQHAYLSLFTDSILAERVALEAAEPLGVPVFPVVPYGITPYFMAYPGTITLRVSTYLEVIRDILASLAHGGFRRIVIVNGHGGNSPAQALADEWMNDHPGVRVKFHNWWNAPRTFAQVKEIDPVASHASWMENFPWTRLANAVMPKEQKPMVDLAVVRQLDAQGTRAYLGDGNFGGYYQRKDEEMLAIWQVGVEETRAVIADGWATT